MSGDGEGGPKIALVDGPLPDGASPWSEITSGGRVGGRFVALAQPRALGGTGGSDAMRRVPAYDPRHERRVVLDLLPRRGAGADEHGAADDGPGEDGVADDGPAEDDEAFAQVRACFEARRGIVHPNLAAVHEIAADEGGLIVVTELPPGPTLPRWVEEDEPGAAATVGIMVQSAHALAAVHAAGLVHGSFGPEHVRVGPDGAPRLTGVAPWRPAPHSPRAEAETIEAAADAMYLAPEQHRGHAADARSDQFALCVALYGALWDRYPFRADDGSVLREAVLGGYAQPPPDAPEVPAHVVEAIMRGLAADPEARHDSMQALADALAGTASRHRTRIALGLAGGAAVVIASLVAWPDAPGTGGALGCADAGMPVYETWNPAARAGLVAYWDRQSPGPRDAVRRRALSRLDSFADRWHQAARDACQGMRRSSSAVVPEGALACLEEQRHELGVTLKILAELGTGTASGPAAVTEGLPRPGQCLDPDSEHHRLFGDDEASVEVRRRLHESGARFDAGDPQAAAELAREALAQAVAADHEAARILATVRLARLERVLGETDEARTHHREAFYAAGRGELDGLAADAAAGLAGVHGDAGELEEAEQWLRTAQMFADRAGEASSERGAGIVGAAAVVAGRRGRADLAVQLHRRAIALREGLPEAGPWAVGKSYNNLGHALMQLGREDEAFGAFATARGLLAAEEGELHPHYPRFLSGYGNALMRVGRLEDAEAALTRARDLTLSVFGERGVELAGVDNNLGILRRRQGRIADAVALYRSAVERRAAAGGSQTPQAATELVNLAVSLLLLGELDEADRIAAESLVRRRTLLGDAHPDTAYARVVVAMVALARKELDAAQQQATRVLDDTAQRPELFGLARRSAWYLGCEVAVAREDWSLAHRRCERAFGSAVDDGGRLALGHAHARLAELSLVGPALGSGGVERRRAPAAEADEALDLCEPGEAKLGRCAAARLVGAIVAARREDATADDRRRVADARNDYVLTRPASPLRERVLSIADSAVAPPPPR